MRRVLALTLLLLGACPLAACTVSTRSESQNREQEARQMVESQLRGRGIADHRVLTAMTQVPRHRYVPREQQRAAYDDRPLPIGYGQTISQPYIVAFMTEALQPQPTDVVLEIGTGSGYQAAILGRLVREVYSIEIVAELAERARRTLEAEGYSNVHVRTGDGYLGWPEHAPFSKIVVTAAPEEVPPVLVDQLAVGGRMILPVGSGFSQELRILSKTATGVLSERSLPVRFVPMIKGPREGRMP